MTLYILLTVNLNSIIQTHRLYKSAIILEFFGYLFYNYFNLDV